MTQPVRAELAVDGDAVLALTADAVARFCGVRPSRCDVQVIKHNQKRVVARYDFTVASTTVALAGKWYGTDRGSVVASTFEAARSVVSVPAVVMYDAGVRALFTEWIDGPLLRDVVGFATGVAAATGAGEWLARFHRSDVRSSRQCGPAKQRGSVERWAREQPELQPTVERLDRALAALADPKRPVHYDFYHQQVIARPGTVPVVIDLDESGRGDPAFDVEHFRAHLELLGLVRHGDPRAFDREIDAFVSGYRSIAPDVPASPALAAFAWCKLLHQALRRHSGDAVTGYARDALGRMLAAA